MILKYGLKITSKVFKDEDYLKIGEMECSDKFKLLDKDDKCIGYVRQGADWLKDWVEVK